MKAYQKNGDSFLHSEIPLIINGDDFGYSAAVNRAIIQAHQEGVLTSASLMVNERATDEAIQLARENSSLAVGLHLVLALGRATLPHTEIPHITDEQNRFPDDTARAGVKYFFSPAARREMRREMRAQFEKFAATQLPFSHVDGHTLLHLHPTIFAELIELCEEFNVRRVRLVKGETRLSLKIDRRGIGRRLLWGAVFGWLAHHCEKKLRGRNFTQPERVYGLMRSGEMTEEYLLELLAQMERRSSEIYLHPLAADADEAARCENPNGALELEALLSPGLRAAISQSNFRLTTYAELDQTK